MKKCSMIFLLCVVAVGLGYAKPMEVIILPTEPGTPSHILYTSKGTDFLLYYVDTIAANSVLTGFADADTFGVFFEPPCSSAIKEVYICLMAYYPDPGAATMPYEGFIADPADTLTLDMWNEYHIGNPVPGPTPIESYFIPPTAMEAGTIFWDWDTLGFAAPETIGYNCFFAGWIIPSSDSTPNPRVEATCDPPHRSLLWRSEPMNGGPPGWYSSWHHFVVLALIEALENMPPQQDLELLPYSYTTGDREVTNHVYDVLGVPAEGHGVESVNLYYAVNYGTATAIPMTRISGDSINGVYSANIPGVSAWDTVSYYGVAADYNGGVDTSETHQYVIRAGTAGNIFFYNDDYYGGGYSYDAVNKVLSNVDFWDNFNDSLGYPDSSVIAFYTPGIGPGHPIIIVNSWSGEVVYEDQDLLKDFLDAGGRLWISSQDICVTFYPALHWCEWYTTKIGCFLREYCKIDSFWDDFKTGVGADSISIFYGVPGDAISGDFAAGITVYPYGFPGPEYHYPGAVVPLPDAVGIFFYETGEASGLRVEDTYKLVFLYWPFAFITDTLAQETLVLNIYSWFTTAIEQEKVVTYSVPCFLFQNSPNPFRTTTVIDYRLSVIDNQCSPNTEHLIPITLKIYDASGRLVKTLVDETLTPYSLPLTAAVVWDGKDNCGKKVASGVYFYRLGTDDFTDTKKMIVLR